MILFESLPTWFFRITKKLRGPERGRPYYWCEECLRWENLDNTGHTRPGLNVASLLLTSVARVFHQISVFLLVVSGWIQIVYLRKTGRGVSEGTKSYRNARDFNVH